MLAKFLCNTRQLCGLELPTLTTSRHAYQMSIKVKPMPEYAPELQRTVSSVLEFNRITSYLPLERFMSKHFLTQPQPRLTDRSAYRPTRLTQKQYFIYLLIDPCVSDNLAERSPHMDKFDVWRCFLAAIFYVGKGKAARPHAHLREAASLFQAADSDGDGKGESALKANEKLQRIWQIWQSNCGVVCVQAFHHVGSHEAHTREAAIIDAIGLMHLVNRKRGQYHGIVKEAFSSIEQQLLGIVLLYKAMHIYLAEGESAIRPQDVIGLKAETQIS